MTDNVQPDQIAALNLPGDAPGRVVTGRVHIAALDGAGEWNAVGSIDAGEWTNLGAGIMTAPAGTPIPTTWEAAATALALPHRRSGHPGDERCGAMGVIEQSDGKIFRRQAFPCWLAPDHGGDVHEGAAGVWLDEGDPRGVETVWPDPAGEVAPAD